MPNWVSTTLSVKGSKEEVQRFLDGITENQILKSYVPCPSELTDTVSGFYAEEEKMAELRKKQEENLAKYGYTDWYEWSYQEWGTKWGDCDTHFEPLTELADGSVEVQGYFQTAWGPADTGFRKVSALFPTLTFLFDYDEEAGFFAGLHAMKDGEIVFESMFEPCNYEGEVDWDDDESIDKYEAWKTENNDRIFDEYQLFLGGVPQ
jgi:hypothetical protein